MTIDVSSTTVAATTQAAQVSSQSSILSSDFGTFLKMLTAQARYQDPLEPIDSTEYASQLAQFSMVEQQVQTNDALAALHTDLNLSNMASLASWVGMEARATMPVYFDGAAITVSPNPASLSDKVELVVHDANGSEVDRQEIPVSGDPIEWRGQAAGGATQPWGFYTFTVESYSGDSLILSEQAEVYDRVTEAQAQDGEILLIFQGGQSALSSSVTGIRQAE